MRKISLFIFFFNLILFILMVGIQIIWLNGARCSVELPFKHLKWAWSKGSSRYLYWYWFQSELLFLSTKLWWHCLLCLSVMMVFLKEHSDCTLHSYLIVTPPTLWSPWSPNRREARCVSTASKMWTRLCSFSKIRRCTWRTWAHMTSLMETIVLSWASSGP